MSWERGHPARETEGRSRPRLLGASLLGLAVLALAFLAGILLTGPGPMEPPAAVPRLLTQLAEMESVERGYLTGGREEEARAHEAAALEVERLLAQARAGTDSGGALESAVADLVAGSRDVVRTRRLLGPEAAARAQSARPAGGLDRLRRILEDVVAVQQAQLQARDAELGSRLAARGALALGAGFLAVAAAALVFATGSRRRPLIEFVDLSPGPEAPPNLEAMGRVGEMFRALLDALDDAVVAMDEHGRVLASNEAAEKALGARAAKTGRDRSGLYLPGSQTHADSPVLRALKGEVVRGAMLRVGGPGEADGRLVAAHARPIRSGGRIRGAVVVLNDVTDLHNAAQTLREAEQKFDLLFESAPFGIVIVEREGRIRKANPSFCRLLGYGPDELRGREVASLTHRADAPREAVLLAELLAGERGGYDLEKRCITKEDVARWLRWTVNPIRDAEGQILYTLASVDDVTERRRLESTARESRELLRRTVDALPVGVWIVDRRGRVRLSNPAGRRIWFNTGDVLRFQEGEYKGWWGDTGERIESQEWGALQAIESGQASVDKVIEVQRFDGTRRTLLSSTIPFPRPDGSVGGAIVVNHDITKEGWTGGERLRLEREMHEAILQVTTLRGLLPVCPLCEKRREDPAYWKRTLAFVREHMAELRDEACRECQSRAYDLSGDASEAKPASKG